MSSWGAILEAACAAAEQSGEEVAPSSLLQLCEGLDDPIAALSGHDEANAIFNALEEEFGFVEFVKASRKPPADADVQRLVGLLRWLVRGLVYWQAADDPRYSRLASLFVVVCHIDIDGQIWRLLPSRAGENTELKERLAQLIGRFRLHMSLAGYSPRPILDQETLDRFHEADAKGDWPLLCQIAEQIHFGLFSNVFFVQAVRFLNRFDFAGLAWSGRSVEQMGAAMQMVTALSVSDGLRLGVVSENAYLQFAAVCRLFSPWDRHSTLCAEEQDQLKALLLSVSVDTWRWRSWMETFNKHPLRSQVLQQALGETLAGAADDALSAYVETIVLSPSPTGRDIVSECLRAFAKAASIDKRRQLWRLAFDRWSMWNFGQHDGYTNLNEIAVSQLDYAIVAYAVESISVREREDTITAMFATASEAEDIWHASATACMSYFYRILSRLQPFLYARDRQSNPGDWLMTDRIYVPEYLRNNLYFRMRYWMREKVASVGTTQE